MPSVYLRVGKENKDRGDDVKKKNNKKLPKRSYEEVMKDFNKASTPKEYREIHKEMKRDYNEGVPIWLRYPKLPDCLNIVAFCSSFISLIIAITVLLIKCIN